MDVFIVGGVRSTEYKISISWYYSFRYANFPVNKLVFVFMFAYAQFVIVIWLWCTVIYVIDFFKKICQEVVVYSLEFVVRKKYF